jgi:hypothetical protein
MKEKMSQHPEPIYTEKKAQDVKFELKMGEETVVKLEKKEEKDKEENNKGASSPKRPYRERKLSEFKRQGSEFIKKS